MARDNDHIDQEGCGGEKEEVLFWQWHRERGEEK
jgi:hypothetical protein